MHHGIADAIGAASGEPRADAGSAAVPRASLSAAGDSRAPLTASALGELRERVRSLPLADRVRLLTGATPWSLHPLEAERLAPIVVSDGPVGVRGVDEESTASAQLPVPSAVAATWDRDLAARLGSLVAREARRKNVDVVLAPVVNLQRTPVGGRHFECFSEDPVLTAGIATAYVGAAQAEGVALCVKHFVGNESETDRTSYVARIDERTLREVYLAPFEELVAETRPWSVMAAYNRIDDGVLSAPATEHGHLVVDVLKGELGFDGVVISDWLAATSTAPSANGGLDLVMPGPGGPWEDRLLAAVEAGEVTEDVIDDKVARILLLGERVGAVGRETPATPGIGEPRGVPADLPVRPETRALLREAVARSCVVLRNDGLLPLASPASIALVGPGAVDPFVQGGGSAYVPAPYLSHPSDALREAFPDAEVSVARGGSSRRHAPWIDPSLVTTPDGEQGYELVLTDAEGRPVGDRRVVPAHDGWNRHVPSEARRARVRARISLAPGRHRLEAGVSGSHRVFVDGAEVSSSDREAGSDVILDSSANHPDGPSVVVEADAPRVVVVEADLQVVDAEGYGTFVRFELRHDPSASDAGEEIEEAARLAASADVAVVVVGTNEETESEGWDRTSLDLPGRQDELVRRVAAANPRTVVVVNAGAPVILPWLDEVAAVVWWWLPGQEAGVGLADALSGATEPSGRLPWTLPARHEDVPIPDAAPVDGVVDYAEGIHVGHRGWDRLGRTPARPFGHGLGYASWRYDAVRVLGWRHGEHAEHGAELVVEVDIENTSARDGREVVQLYLQADEADGAAPAAGAAAAAERPVRWLAAFAAVDVAAGGRETVRLGIRRRRFETWDAESHRWTTAAGAYRVLAGRSSRELPLEAPVVVTDVTTTPQDER